MKRNAAFLVLLLLMSFIAINCENNQIELTENVTQTSIQSGTILSNGTNFEWLDTYISSKDDDTVEVRAYDSAMDDEGNLYVVGRHSTGFSIQGISVVPTNGNGGSGIFLLKFSSDGVIDWGIGSQTTGTLISYAGGFTVDVDSDGFVYIGGRVSFSSGSGSMSFENQSLSTPGLALVKISNNGTVIWASSAYTPSNEESLNDIFVDEFGEIFIVGTYYGTLTYNNGQTCTSDSTDNRYRPFIAHVNDTGYWQRCHDLTPANLPGTQGVATGITESDNHLFVCVTNSTQVGSASSVFVPTVIKFNKTQFMNRTYLYHFGLEWEISIPSSISGQNTVMSVNYGGSNAYFGGGIAIDSQGSIVIVGHGRAGTSGSAYDPWAAKLDQNGSILWYEEFPDYSTEMA